MGSIQVGRSSRHFPYKDFSTEKFPYGGRTPCGLDIMTFYFEKSFLKPFEKELCQLDIKIFIMTH